MSGQDGLPTGPPQWNSVPPGGPSAFVAQPPPAGFDLNPNVNGAASDDARQVLGFYPFIQHTPSSRVARHLSSLTITRPPPMDPAQLYPAQTANIQQTLAPGNVSSQQQQHIYAEAVRLMKAYAPPGRVRTDSGVAAPLNQAQFAPVLPTKTRIDLSNGERSHLPPISASYPSDDPFIVNNAAAGPSATASLLPFINPPAPIYHPQADPSDQTPSFQTALPGGGTVGSEFITGYVQELTRQRLEEEERQRMVLQAKEAKQSVNTTNVQKNPPQSSSLNATPPTRLQGVSDHANSPDPLSFSNSPLKRKLSHAQMLSGPSGRQPSPTKMAKVNNKDSNVEFAIPLLPTPRTSSSPQKASPQKASRKSKSASLTENQRLVPVVEIPVRSRSRSASSTDRFKSPHASEDEQMEDDDEDDVDADGDYDMGWQIDGTPEARMEKRRVSGSGRTGERDLRGHHQKLLDLVDSIFEEEDQLSGDVTSERLHESMYFCRSSAKESDIPLLSRKTIHLLATHISRVSKVNAAGGINATDTKGKASAETPSRLAQWDVERLTRLLSLLERSVSDGDSVKVFKQGTAKKMEREASGSPTKQRGRPKKQRTTSAEQKTEDRPMEDAESTEEARLFEEGISRIDEAVSAAEVSLRLLSAKDMPKQIYSEDLITKCFGVIDLSLSSVILPFADAVASPASASSALLRRIVTAAGAESVDHRRFIESLFTATTAAVSQCSTLVSSTDAVLSESHVSQAVYLSMQPLFSTDIAGETKAAGKSKEQIVKQAFGSKTGLHTLRMSALTLLKALYARNASQREWMLEEVLGRLVKLSDVKRSHSFYRLRDGRTIHIISAVLLQLMQSCGYGMRHTIRKLRSERAASSRADEEEGYQPVTVATVQLEKTAFDEYLEAAGRSTMIVFKSLINKLTTATATKGSGKTASEVEYKSILDTLLADIVTVLYLPDWPASSIAVTAATKILASTSALTGPKTAGESSTLRLLAAEHLGSIAAKLRTTTLAQRAEDAGNVEKMACSADSTQWENLTAAYDRFLHLLSKDEAKESMQSSALDFWVAQWSQEICKCYLNVVSTNQQESPELLLARGRLEAQIIKIASDITDDSLFDVQSQDEALTIEAAATALQVVRPLDGAFESIIEAILHAMDADAVAVRTKAIRSLGVVATSDMSLLTIPTVKTALQDRFSDSSPQVRDAAVELLGRYIMQSPDLADLYYTTIAMRVIDTGIGVRKRVIKIMKAIYGMTSDAKIRIDICKRLILLVQDDDEAVKDLAVSSLASIWMPRGLEPLNRMRETPESATNDVANAQRTASILMGIASYFKELNGPLDEVVYEIVSKNPAESKAYFAGVLDVLVEYLIDASERPDLNVFACVRACHVLCHTMPSIVTVDKAMTLLPYLQGNGTPEEQSMTDMLLRVYRLSIPFMPKTASNFAVKLTQALLPMINKPSRIAALPETVACYCAAVMHLTHDYTRVLSIYQSCETKIRNVNRVYRESGTVSPQVLRQLPMLLVISSSLVAGCDLDSVKTDREDIASALETITTTTFVDHAYDMLLEVRTLPLDVTGQQIVMQSLGALFHAHPTLMLRETSTDFMDHVLASEDYEAQERVYRLIQSFLLDEASKKDSERVAKMEKGEIDGAPKGVNISELVGDTAGFAESGVASAVVQRYLSSILKAALSPHRGIQSVAMDIVSFTVRQGLAHPIQCLPVLVSLETSPESVVADSAFALHTLLHNKHSSHLNSKYLENARAAFAYQQTLDAEPSGFRQGGVPIALLDRWYSLVRDKRGPRQDFLRGVSRCFDFETLSPKMSRDELMFCRFMADNLALLEYKTQDEVLTVITQLSQILSTSGQHLVDSLSSAQLDGAADELIMEMDVKLVPLSGEMVESAGPAISASTLLNCATVLGVTLLLKSHLQSLYGLGEDRCAKFKASGKATTSDKVATRKSSSGSIVPDWSRLHGIERPAVTVGDFQAQKEAILTLVEEDGTMHDHESNP